jgi:opacity protein-like surface antigen
MKKIIAFVVMVICLLGTISVANANLLDVFRHPYLSAAPAYGWDLKGYGRTNLGNEKSRASGYDLKFGIDILPNYFAVEEEYLELNGFKCRVTEINPSYLLTLDGTFNFKIVVSNLKFKYPFKVKNVKISPFFTLGAGYADMTLKTSYDLEFSGQHITGSSTGVSRYPCDKTGGGVDMETKHFRFSLEYSLLEIRNTNTTDKNGYTANVVMTGIGYKF